MDLVADTLVGGLKTNGLGLQVSRIRPTFRPRVKRIPGGGRLAFNADRLIHRMRDYPRYLRGRAQEFDLFHIADHSYAHLVHELPAVRAGVFCHDLDTFRCLLDPVADPRPFWFRRMTRRILTGMQKAAVVFYTTNTIRAQIENYGLIDSARLVQAPYGVAHEFTPDESEAPALPAAIAEGPFLLHVGSCIPRKRVDVLLEVMTQLRGEFPELRFFQVGGEFSESQLAQITQYSLNDVVIQLPRQDHQTIAALYRRAALVVMPSEAEGFGIPVIEGLACGAVVVASDIPVFREVGGDSLVYCPVGEVDAWSAGIREQLHQPETSPSLGSRLARAAEFTWANHARIIAAEYEKIL
ncbi:MAG: glycosyltransferase [Pyrinomonadaceae bacterium]